MVDLVAPNLKMKSKRTFLWLVFEILSKATFQNASLSGCFSQKGKLNKKSNNLKAA